MRIATFPALALAAGLLVGCGSTLPDADSLVVDVKVETAAVGADLPFRFANASAEQVVTGALDCVVTYERQVAGRWVPVAPLRACIELVELHPPGSARDYVTVAPDQAGLWRLVVQAWGREVILARSQRFVVVAAD